MLASRLAQKSSCTSSFLSTRNLVLCRNSKSCLVVPIAPRPFVRCMSSVPPTMTWVDRLPARIRPYVYLTRIDKPIGTLLLFYPCGMSLDPYFCPAQRPHTSVVDYHGVLRAPSPAHDFAFIPRPLRPRRARDARRGVHNQRHVGQEPRQSRRSVDRASSPFTPVTHTHAPPAERTRTRPLARGDITRRQALGFLAGQLTVGLGVLLQLNTYRCVGRRWRRNGVVFSFLSSTSSIASSLAHPRSPSSLYTHS